jgi:hypothetical protein
MVVITISGHTDPIIVLVSKERSDQLVLQYVGRAYDDLGYPWTDWGFLIVCPEGSEDIAASGYMIDISDPNNRWEIDSHTTGDGVTGVILNESGGATPIEGQTPTVDLTGRYDGSNLGTPDVKIHGEFDTTKWPDRLSGWWKSYFGSWNSNPTIDAEGKWDSARATAPPVRGEIRIDITGQPKSFFDGRICQYAVCQTGGNPNTPADHIAEGTINLVSGSGIGEVENLAKGQYDVYVAVDVDSDGYTFSEGHPFNGDLHDAETNITIETAIVEVIFTLKTVAGEVSWSPTLSGDVYVYLCTHVPPPPPPGGFTVEHQVSYHGIASATSTTYAMDVTDMSGGPYYLLGVLTPPGGNLLNALRGSWYDGADGATGTDIPPVDLSNLQDSYDFFLPPP